MAARCRTGIHSAFIQPVPLRASAWEGVFCARAAPWRARGGYPSGGNGAGLAKGLLLGGRGTLDRAV